MCIPVPGLLNVESGAKHLCDRRGPVPGDEADHAQLHPVLCPPGEAGQKLWPTRPLSRAQAARTGKLLHGLRGGGRRKKNN